MFNAIRSNEFTKAIFRNETRRDVKILNFNHTTDPYNNLYIYWSEVELEDGTIFYSFSPQTRSEEQLLENIAIDLSTQINKFLDITNGIDYSSKLGLILTNCLYVKYVLSENETCEYRPPRNFIEYVNRFITYSKIRLGGEKACLVDIYNDCMNNYTSKYAIY